MRFIPVVAVLITATPALAQEPPPPPHLTGPLLTVTAEAKAHAAPDMATVSTGVMTTAKTAAEAMKANAADMTRVVDEIKKSGVEAKDIQTSGLSLSAQYEYPENRAPKVTGYQAVNNVTVVLHALDKVGPTLDALVATGANQISGPTFAIAEEDAVLDGARAEAVAKAKSRAELYAKAAGLTVKRIVAINEGGASAPPVMPMMARKAMMVADAATPVEGGQMELTASVTVTFELQ